METNYIQTHSFDTREEMEEFWAFKADKAKKEKAERDKQDRDAYRQIVNQSVEEILPLLVETSELLARRKAMVYDTFKNALEMKMQLFDNKSDNISHTFTNKECTKRIIIGSNQTDNYDITAEDGIAMIKSCITELGTDDKSKALVSAVLRLLSRDQKGNLKASRVLQLQKTADELGDERLIEGVKIIREAYNPIESKTYVRAEIKDEKTNAWVSVPLGITEA
ncbi:MAG: DUF3164 family protein [Prevotellaceae bacterium]|jgi:hypothetical protein|nr:DUF3164 family protein [Prevotellaceae bacterium]